MLCLTNQIIAQIFVTCGESVLGPYFLDHLHLVYSK